MKRITSLLPVLCLAVGALAFFLGALTPAPAEACYQNYPSSAFCYEPFVCNSTPLRTAVLEGAAYSTYTSYWIPCATCPSQSYESLYGIDPCLPD